MTKARGINDRHHAPGRKKLLRIAGLPAVSALFATAPERVERLFFDARLKPHENAFCAELARRRKSYRLAGADEMKRIAGSAMHGGIVALAAPRPVGILHPATDAAKLAEWARGARPFSASPAWSCPIIRRRLHLRMRATGLQKAGSSIWSFGARGTLRGRSPRSGGTILSSARPPKAGWRCRA